MRRALAEQEAALEAQNAAILAQQLLDDEIRLFCWRHDMAIYVYDKALGAMVDKVTREPMVSGPWQPVTPRVWSDLPAYRSPVDGSMIEDAGRAGMTLEKNNCVDANDLPSPTGGRLKTKPSPRSTGFNTFSG